jgi:branched-chain amino acid transport system permease protein
MIALQQLLNGLTLGAVYTLVALAFSLVMGVLGVLNIAVAELFMVGAYAGLSALAHGAPLPLAVIAGMACAGGLALVIERVAYRPFAGAPPIVPLLSTLGCSIVLQNAVVNLFGSDPLQLPDSAAGSAFEFAGLRISTPQLTVIGCAILLVGAAAWLVQRTRFGRALRAVAENPGVSRLLGVPAQRVVSGTFLLSGVLAGAAGVLIGLHYSAVNPFVGADAGLKAIAVMVIGGVTRIWGVLLAGPLVGIAEVMTIYLGGSAVRDFVVYGLMIATLLLRPHGLLGKPPGQEGERL